MQKETLLIKDYRCTLCADDKPMLLLIQMVDDHDEAFLDQEIYFMRQSTAIPFALAAVKVKSWNNDLSPWTHPPVFGKESFGDGADKTLQLLENDLIPLLFDKYGKLPVILGGYSLSGLFATYAAYTSTSFAAIAACSPSLWFTGFEEYTQKHIFHSQYIYLSLGNKEEHTKNPIMRTVGNKIRSLKLHFDSLNIPSTLVWNEGNHFKEPDKRTADGFVSCIDFLTK